MNWLTFEQVEVAGKKSHEAALECSQEHWRQLSQATRGEIGDASDLCCMIRAPYCALCERYRSGFIVCEGCPLKQVGYSCCRSWQEASDAETAYSRCPDEDNWRSWRRAAKAMYRKLMRCK